MTTTVLIKNGDLLKVQGQLDCSRAEGTSFRNDSIGRASLIEESLAAYSISLRDLYVWDAPASSLPTTPATDDLGYIARTWATDAEKVQTEDLKSAGATDKYACFSWTIPPEFVDDGDFKIRIGANMVTTVADTSCTLDLVAYALDGEGSIGADLCTTAATDMNSLTFAEYDFEITSSGLSVGDRLEFRVHIACNDAAGGAVVKAQISKIQPLLDIKG